MLLYELMHKRVPFIGRRIEDVRQSLLKTKLGFKPGLSADLRDLMTQLLEKNVHRRIPLSKILEHEALQAHHRRVLEKHFPEQVAEKPAHSRAKKVARYNGKSISMTDNHVSGVYTPGKVRLSNQNSVARASSNGLRTVASQNAINNVLPAAKSIKNIYNFQSKGFRKITPRNLLYNQNTRPKGVQPQKNDSVSVELSLKIRERSRPREQRTVVTGVSPSIKRYLSMDKLKLRLELAPEQKEHGRVENPIREQKNGFAEAEVEEISKKPPGPAKAANPVKAAKIKGLAKPKPGKEAKPAASTSKAALLSQAKLASKPRAPKRNPRKWRWEGRGRRAQNFSKKALRAKGGAGLVSEGLRPKIINRKRGDVSNEKLLGVKQSFADLYSKNAMFQTAQLGKGKAQGPGRDLRLNLAALEAPDENEAKPNWNAGPREAKPRASKMVQTTQNFFRPRAAHFETPQKFISPEIRALKQSAHEFVLDADSAQAKRLFRKKRSTKQRLEMGSAVQIRGEGHLPWKAPAKAALNAPGKAEAGPRLSQFTKTVKMTCKNEGKAPPRGAGVSAEAFLREQRKTVKRSRLKKTRAKPKAQPGRLKKTPRERAKGKMDLHSRLREMNKIRTANKFSIYEDYLKKMKSDVNKISLKTYYKIPRECTDFRKPRKP